MENARESPRSVRERLHVLDLDAEYVARFGMLDLERARNVVDASQIGVFDVFGGIVVADLAAEPVDAFDLDGFVIGNPTVRGNYIVASPR